MVKKVKKLERKAHPIRLTSEIFTIFAILHLGDLIHDIKLSTGLVANHLLVLSYVSMQTALRYYGLIPEAVYTTQFIPITP